MSPTHLAFFTSLVQTRFLNGISCFFKANFEVMLVCYFFLKLFVCAFSNYAFWPTLKQGWVRVLNHLTYPVIQTINHFIKAVRYLIFCNFLGTQASLNIIFRHLVNLSGQKGEEDWIYEDKSAKVFKNWSEVQVCLLKLMNMC